MTGGSGPAQDTACAGPVNRCHSIGAPPVKRHFRPSLAWRLCLVGQGRFDIMVTLRAAYEWDIAAGSLIAAEAGAVVTDGEGGALEFNRHPARAPGVIAAPEALHRALMARRRAD